MSPVQQRKVRDPRSLALALGGLILGVVLLVGVFVFAIPRLTESSTVRVRPQSNSLMVGDAREFAGKVAESGPFQFADLAGGSRDLYVQHVGTDPLAGWSAFDARRPGTGRECNLTWDQAARHFNDPCDKTTVPADGAGLPHYVVEVNDGQLSVVLISPPTTTVLVTGSVNR
jgi:hypothetical protein